MEDGGRPDPLGEGAVTGGGDELGELRVGHGGRGDRERSQGDGVNGMLTVGLVAVPEGVAHQEVAAGQVDEFRRH